jgi:hypothetical protein
MEGSYKVIKVSVLAATPERARKLDAALKGYEITKSPGGAIWSITVSTVEQMREVEARLRRISRNIGIQKEVMKV